MNLMKDGTYFRGGNITKLKYGMDLEERKKFRYLKLY